MRAEKGAPAAAGLACAVLALLCGCAQPSSVPDAPPAVSLNQPHAMSIGSFGTRMVTFDTTVAGSYTIAVTSIDAGADMSWDLFDDPEDWGDYDPEHWIGWCDNDSGGNGDEIAAFDLLASTRYYLVLDEWEDPGDRVEFVLSITSP
jgi:hypothetical protein